MKISSSIPFNINKGNKYTNIHFSKWKLPRQEAKDDHDQDDEHDEADAHQRFQSLWSCKVEKNVQVLHALTEAVQIGRLLAQLLKDLEIQGQPFGAMNKDWAKQGKTKGQKVESLWASEFEGNHFRSVLRRQQKTALVWVP